MQGSYPRDAVQPVSVERKDDGEATIAFVAPLESLYYVGGVSYQTEATTLRVRIDRCPIQSDCSTMAPASRPLGEGRTTSVRVPFDGQRIVMVHADGEQQIYP